MKITRLLLPLSLFMLVGCQANNANIKVKKLAMPSLPDLFQDYDYNFLRETTINLSEDAFNESKEIQNKLNFPFTLKRKTLFDDNKLYMTTLDEKEPVNAGYYSLEEEGQHQLYRYTLPNENPESYIDSTTVPEGFESVKQVGYQKECNQFFVNMHKFKDPTWIEKFTKDGDSYVSSDEEVLKDFLAFTASCFLNNNGEEESKEYVHFEKARISTNDDNSVIIFELFAKEEDYSKIDPSIKNGLFSVAEVSKPGEIKIPVLDAYLESIKNK